MAKNDGKRPTEPPAAGGLQENLDDFDLPDLDQLFGNGEPDTGVSDPPKEPSRKEPLKAAVPEPLPEPNMPDLPDWVADEPEPAPKAKEPSRKEPIRKEAAKEAAKEAGREAAKKEPAKKEAPKKEPPKSEPPPSIFSDEGSDDGDFLSSQTAFRKEAQKLARSRDWERLAATISAALDTAAWAEPPEVKVSLLFDLGRVHRDRLQDLPSAENALRRLVDINPAHTEALELLSDLYERNGDWQSLYLLTAGAIEATWDPAARLDWTRRAVAIAADRLGSSDLVLEAWERLWKLGDFPDEAAAALSEAYRREARWDRLAAFLRDRAHQADGAARVVVLREAAEAYLSALRDHDRAAELLQEIQKSRPDDAVSLLGMARVHARRHDWESLEKLAATTIKPESVSIDVLRLVADALWHGEELDRAARVLDRILATEPRDAEALSLKEQYLSKSGKTGELVQLLSARADETKDEAERAELLARATALAERDLDDPRRAAELLEKRAAIPKVRLEALRDLARLYENISDHEGLRRALEGELALTRNPQGRVEVLRRLAEHCAHRLGDDARAESCWRDLLAAVPDDPAVRDELVALYRRRGDFASVDRTLCASAWRPLDDGSLVEVWRAAAKNAQENLSDPTLTLRAWRRVCDLQPDDPEALSALVALRRTQTADPHALIDAIERTLRLTSSDERMELTLETARLSEESGDRAAALATYERILAWDPKHPAALSALARLRPNGVTRGAIEAALTAIGDDPTRRAALLEQLLSLQPAADPLAQLSTLKRVLAVTGPTSEVMSRLQKAAAEANAWELLAVIYAELAAQANEAAERTSWYRRAAALFEKELRDPLRALLTLSAARQPTVASLDEISDLLRLAEATARPEDGLALLELATRAEVPEAVRREALCRRVAICEKLGAPERAFAECARLLALDPHSTEALAAARRAAQGAGLWRHLDGLYAELRDRAESDNERLQLTLEKHKLRMEQLKDPAAALDELLFAYRLDSNLRERTLETARELRAWDDVLPVVEGRLLAGDSPSADELLKLAQLHHAERKDLKRAFDLDRLAFELQPASDREPILTELAQATSQWPLLADSLRTAAARAGGSPRSFELYRSAAALYGDKVQRPDLALDVHQRILQLQPSDLSSLLVVIDHQRKTGLGRELRESLQRWIELTGSSDAKKTIEVLLEIARLSRTQLADPETALSTYARVLTAEPKNTEALEGIRSLTEGPIEPALQLRRLRVELAQASGDDKTRLLLRMAELQEKELDDPAGALETLSMLVAETGENGPGAEPLDALLKRRGDWSEVTERMAARAAATSDRAARLSLLGDALKLADEHEVPANTREQLCRKILAEDPADRATVGRLLQLLRMGGRHADEAKLLEELLAANPDERAFFDELVRLRANALNEADRARQLVEARLKQSPDDAAALSWQATLWRRRGDLVQYSQVRERLAKASRPHLGALILCHLAEVRDELGNDQARVIELYREARTIDASCTPAMEALKALGRRIRNWREAASLLPGDDSKKLKHEERSARLRERGDASREADAAVALSWYERAVAVDPDDHLAWDALADLDGDLEIALEARRESLQAYERAIAPEATRLEEHARRIQALSEAEAAAGNDEAAAALSRRAFALMPSLPSSALAVAERHEMEREPQLAMAVYDKLLGRADSLEPNERIRARYGRGRLLAHADRLDEAINDLRDGLRLEGLHSGLLQALADVLRRKGRFAAAVQHYITALLLAHDDASRAGLYARIGLLWDERLVNPEEAGVCYDLAIAHGSDDADVMARALGHYRRSDRGERALAVIERLLPITTDGRTLAMLWAERGRIYAKSDGDKAMEAFDLALSYDPACQPAVDGLAALLEQRGDWKQLVDLLEVRAESGSLESRAEALRALARISREHLKDDARTERLLLEAARLQPKKKDYEELIALYGNQPAKAGKRREAVAAQMALGGPWMSRLVELGRELAAEGRRRWAWCLLSPLMSTTIPDSATKAVVLDLRKEFEKGDHVDALSPESVEALRHPDVTPGFWSVLAELDGLVTYGPATLEAAGVHQAARLDGRTAIGKSFGALAERLGVPDALLHRASDLAVPYVILDGEPAQIVVRGDLLPLLSPTEITFWLTNLLASSQPGARVLSAAAPAEAHNLLSALFLAVGLAEGTPGPLVETLRDVAGGDRISSWRDRLRDVAPLGPERLLAAVRDSALRAALYAVPDLRLALKLLGRVDETMPKATSTGHLEDLDELFAGSAAARGLAAFAASSAFGERL